MMTDQQAPAQPKPVQMAMNPTPASVVGSTPAPLKATPMAPPPSADIVGTAVNPSPLRNVNPAMRNMATPTNTIQNMPNTNAPMRSPYGQ